MNALTILYGAICLIVFFVLGSIALSLNDARDEVYEKCLTLKVDSVACEQAEKRLETTIKIGQSILNVSD